MPSGPAAAILSTSRTSRNHARLATDAIEIHRDLGQPQAALRWSRLAIPMPAGRYTRATGIRLAVLASSHIQEGDLDQGLAAAARSLDILSKVQSTRARSYLHVVVKDLEPWRADARVKDFAHRAGADRRIGA
ncbi:hypothetical protein [Streptomyces zhihengii]|uniref:hypothetical protein n=1 Tax=Streptomyces zhihengii TaxID=1818004 RepID=UPI0033A37D5A